ncbi:MAG: LysR family transcriptional regulator [Burkholderiales bacterium]|nr:LysR family transcriptional regulator [Burkholderiales bacterium]
MDTRFLESFVCVVELGSIAAAARQLDLTAASVAQRLRSLEASVGSPLIVRAGRTVKPTVQGRRVLAHAQSVLREVRDLKSAASATGLPAGPLRLGTTPTGMTGMLPPVLREWVARYPQIEIYMEPAATVLLHARVLAGELDAALLVHPLFELPKVCAWKELRREKLVLVTPARMRVKDALEAIATEPFILYDRKVVGGKLADSYLRELGVRPIVRFELDGIEAIAKLVSEGLGISVLPDWAVLGRGDTTLRRWPLPEPCPIRRVGLLSLRSSVRAPLVDAFAALASKRWRP